jgi:flagellin
MASILNIPGSGQNRADLNRTLNFLENTLNRLSTGSRINRASDDAAGLQISNNLRADIRVNRQAQVNANYGLGITDIADGSLNNATGLLNRAAEIATQAASGTTSQSGRDALNQEFQNILAEIDDLGLNTRFDGEQIFGGNFDTRVGESDSQTVSVNPGELSADSLSLAGTDLLSEGNASTALGAIQGAIEGISAQRGSIGATQSRLQSSIDSLIAIEESTLSAESQIRDADIAEEVVNRTKFQILAESQNNALVQRNLQAQQVTQLLNF